MESYPKILIRPKLMDSEPISALYKLLESESDI